MYSPMSKRSQRKTLDQNRIAFVRYAKNNWTDFSLTNHTGYKPTRTLLKIHSIRSGTATRRTNSAFFGTLPKNNGDFIFA